MNVLVEVLSFIEEQAASLRDSCSLNGVVSDAESLAEIERQERMCVLFRHALVTLGLIEVNGR